MLIAYRIFPVYPNFIYSCMQLMYAGEIIFAQFASDFFFLSSMVFTVSTGFFLFHFNISLLHSLAGIFLVSARVLSHSVPQTLPYAEIFYSGRFFTLRVIVVVVVVAFVAVFSYWCILCCVCQEPEPTGHTVSAIFILDICPMLIPILSCSGLFFAHTKMKEKLEYRGSRYPHRPRCMEKSEKASKAQFLFSKVWYVLP